MTKIDTSGRRFRKRDDVYQQLEISLDHWGSVSAAMQSSDYTIDEPDAVAMIISDHDEIFELNYVAAFVWERLAEDLSVDELAAAVAGAFDVETEVATQDIAALVEELHTRGLARDVTPV